MSSSEQETTTNSATPAEPRYRAYVKDPNLTDINNVKCPTCKESTEHMSTMVEVASQDPNEDMLEVLQKQRRLKICRVCATMSVAK